MNLATSIVKPLRQTKNPLRQLALVLQWVLELLLQLRSLVLGALVEPLQYRRMRQHLLGHQVSLLDHQVQREQLLGPQLQVRAQVLEQVQPANLVLRLATI